MCLQWRDRFARYWVPILHRASLGNDWTAKYAHLSTKKSSPLLDSGISAQAQASRVEDSSDSGDDHDFEFTADVDDDEMGWADNEEADSEDDVDVVAEGDAVRSADHGGGDTFRDEGTMLSDSDGDTST
jgi:hypothetical protein